MSNQDRAEGVKTLTELADSVVISNATGNESLFIAAVQELIAGVRKAEAPQAPGADTPGGRDGDACAILAAHYFAKFGTARRDSILSGPWTMEEDAAIRAVSEALRATTRQSDKRVIALVVDDMIQSNESCAESWIDRLQQVVTVTDGDYPAESSGGDAVERCEGGQPECGPVEFHDVEGVPLCRVCWEGLIADAAIASGAEHGR